MRWFGGLLGMFLVVFVIGGIAFAAYEVGFDQGFEDGVVQTVAGTSEGGSIIVQDRTHGGWFPFGFFGIVLGWFMLMALFRALFHRPWAHHSGGHGGWRRGGPEAWRERAREVHDAWHAEARGTDGSPSAPSSS